MLMRPTDERRHTPYINILGDDKDDGVMDLGPEDKARLQAIIETFWSDIDPRGHYVEHYANNREAGPSNRLIAGVHHPEILNRLGTETGRAPAQTCVEDVHDNMADVALAVTLFASIWRSEPSNTQKGGN